MRSLIIGLALLLGACTTQGAALVDAGVEKVKASNDTTARTILAATCGISVGALYRLESPTQREAVQMLCGATIERNLTLGDLQRFMASQSE